jgi:hypothetical protein
LRVFDRHDREIRATLRSAARCGALRLRSRANFVPVIRRGFDDSRIEGSGGGLERRSDVPCL